MVPDSAAQLKPGREVLYTSAALLWVSRRHAFFVERSCTNRLKSHFVAALFLAVPRSKIGNQAFGVGMSETHEAPSAKRGHRTRWIVGAVVAILVIFVLVHIFEGKKPPKATPPQVVKVSKASRGDMPETLSELGTVTPTATVTVLPQLSGYLTQVGYNEGQDVKKGQFLAQIDPRQYEIDLQQAQA